MRATGTGTKPKHTVKASEMAHTGEERRAWRSLSRLSLAADEFDEQREEDLSFRRELGVAALGFCLAGICRLR
jgi:hypothetical protein